MRRRLPHRPDIIEARTFSIAELVASQRERATAPWSGNNES